MKLVFWISLGVVAFAYAGYPLVMAVLARFQHRPLTVRKGTPSIDVLMVVHNAAAQLPVKLANLLALDYPSDQLVIHVVCDGCSDASEAIARDYPSKRIHVHAFAERRGKSACIGNVLPLLTSELVLFNDVRQRLEIEAPRALALALSDPTVGAASGELMLEASNGYGRGVDAYWRYEKVIRRLESASGSLVGVTGAIYAARRSVIPEVPAGLVLDDMWIPLSIAAAGYRVVFVPEARAFDHASTDAVAEEQRKRRTLAGNFQLLHRWPQLAIPGAHPLALRLWGHKWLRLLAPWLLLVALLSSLGLALQGSTFYLLLLVLQMGGYATAALGRLFPALAGRLLPVRLATAFLSLNTSAMWALADYLKNPNAHLWQTTRTENLQR
ncbi:MAG: glycosyltransferase family 2 protein [Pseudoxanthomonas sp.]